MIISKNNANLIFKKNVANSAWFSQAAMQDFSISMGLIPMRISSTFSATVAIELQQVEI